MARNEFVSVSVTGLSRVTRALLEFGVEVDDLKDAMADIAKQGQQIAAAHAPFKTGRLRGDIRGNRARNKASVISGSAAVPYAGPINFGWEKHHISPSGYLQAVDTVMGPKAPELLQKSLNDLIRRYGLG